jgi:hypothetical protein
VRFVAPILGFRSEKFYSSSFHPKYSHFFALERPTRQLSRFLRPLARYTCQNTFKLFYCNTCIFSNTFVPIFSRLSAFAYSSFSTGSILVEPTEPPSFTQSPIWMMGQEFVPHPDDVRRTHSASLFFTS